MCASKPGNTYDQYAIAVEKNESKRKPFAVEGFVCLRSISEEQQSYSLQRSWMTEMKCSGDLHQGGVGVELCYSGAVFRGSNFSWCISFCG